MNQRARLFLSFIAIIGINILVVTTFVIYNNTKNNIRSLNERLDLSQILLLQDFKTIGDFLREEVNDPDFFITGESSFHLSHIELTDSINIILDNIKQQNGEKVESLLPQIDTLMLKVIEYQFLFEDVSRLLLSRGFKDFGLVGVMRNYAHEIEDNYNYYPSDLLMLRRHEKDYIIRRDQSYIDKFNYRAKILKQEIKADSGIPAKKKKELIYFLNNYVEVFNAVVEKDKKIGLFGRDGIKQEIWEHQNNIELLLARTSVDIKKRLKSLQNKYFLVTMGITVFLFLIGVALSIFLSAKITKPLSLLSEHINDYVKGKFQSKPSPLISLRNDEIGVLFKNFNILKEELRKHISELRGEKEKAEKANVMKGLFVAKISHEVRTPISGVISMSRLLEKTKLDVDQKTYVETINYSSNNLLKIVNDILDFSKIESGALELEQFNFDLNKELKKVVSFLDFKARERGLKLKLEIEEDVPLFLKGDPLRLTQIITNLVSNALKYTMEGGVELYVKQLKAANKKIELMFEISDTGIGMDQETLYKLFRPYEQGGISTARLHGGTGLGLVISKELVNMMGGEIGVRSKIDKGSTFWFTSFFEDADPDFNYSLTKEEKEYFANKKFLILETDPGYRQNMIYKLEKIGVEVRQPNNLDEALDEFQMGKIDYFIVDSSIPEFGNQVTEERLSLVQDNLKKRIVVLVYDDDESIKENLSVQGIKIFVKRPFKVKELIREIENHIMGTSKN